MYKLMTHETEKVKTRFILNYRLQLGQYEGTLKYSATVIVVNIKHHVLGSIKTQMASYVRHP